MEFHGLTRILALIPLLSVACLGTGPTDAHVRQIVGSAASPRGAVEQITVIRRSGGRVAWSPHGDRILIDAKGEDGYYDLFLIRPDGTGEECLTANTGGVLSDGHKGTAEWHPSGEYIVFQSQKKADTGNWGRDRAASPGFGRYMDLWLLELETRRFFRLTDTQPPRKSGVLHPHFSHDGRTLSWSEMWKPPDWKNGVGYWKIKVADFAMGREGPRLTNVRTFEPAGEPGFYENHGLSPDRRKLLFTSDIGREPGFLTSVLYHYDLATGRLERLAAERWNEHAHYTPDGRRILWMTGRENPRRGTDYWLMNLDGTGKRRVTDFNNRDLPSNEGHVIVAADASFSPDGRRLVAYLQVDLLAQVGAIVVIDLATDR